MSEGHVPEEQVLFWPRQEIVLDDFAAEGYILDIGGGGEGIIGQLKGGRVVAIDPNRRELEEAAPNGLQIVMDATDLQFLDNAFSTATAFFTLLYIKGSDLRRVLAEVFRVLAPGGRFLVWDAALPTRPDTDKDVIAVMLTVVLSGREIQTGYGTRWPPVERDLPYYESLAREAGFEVAASKLDGRLFTLELVKPS